MYKYIYNIFTYVCVCVCTWLFMVSYCFHVDWPESRAGGWTEEAACPPWLTGATAHGQLMQQFLQRELTWQAVLGPVLQKVHDGACMDVLGAARAGLVRGMFAQSRAELEAVHEKCKQPCERRTMRTAYWCLSEHLCLELQFLRWSSSLPKHAQ